jgi:geranylgeranyl diphosphate synthase, type II
MAGNLITRLDPQGHKKIQEDIEKAIADALVHTRKISPLSDAVRYVLFGGGKRLRPSLSTIILYDLAFDYSNFLSIAVALEYLHTASLVHDDLPAIDNDTTRRGRNTCHVEFNEATAVLVGDVLVSLANELVLGSKLKADTKCEILKILNNAYSDLCYGQQLDLLPAKSIEELANIASFKTGALFGATLAVPFVYAEFSYEMIIKAHQLGIQLGVCYQIFDDIEDASGFANYGDSKSLKIFFEDNLYSLKKGLKELSMQSSLNEFENTISFIDNIFR